MDGDPATLCNHCKARPIDSPRGLCQPCFKNTGIRNRYKVGSVMSSRSEFESKTPFPPEPTTAQPGSEEKIQVYEWRVQNGYRLWHPDDR